MPDDPDQVIYVWYHALGNYITSLGYGTDQVDYRTWWIESDHRVHVIGKGILRFHAVYWPAFLLSAGEPTPTAIFVHDYLTIGGEKIAKSTGNIIDPTDLVDAYGSDPLHWWFAIDLPRLGDADFTEKRLIERANEELANGYGNLVNRITTLVEQYRPDGPPLPSEQDPLLQLANETQRDVHERLDHFNIRAAASAIAELIRAANAYIQEHRPWEQARVHDHAGFDHTIGSLWATAVQIGDLLRIFTPDLATKAHKQLKQGTSGVVQPRLEARSS